MVRALLNYWGLLRRYHRALAAGGVGSVAACGISPLHQSGTFRRNFNRFLRGSDITCGSTHTWTRTQASGPLVVLGGLNFLF